MTNEHVTKKNIIDMYMPGKSASNSPSKKRSPNRSSGSPSKKRRTQPHPSDRLTPPSPKNLNMRPNAPNKPASPKGKTLKSHSKKSWRNLLRGPSEGNLMKERMAKMERRYQHYLRTGQVRPLSP